MNHDGFLRGGETITIDGSAYPVIRLDQLQPGDWFSSDTRQALRQYAGICEGAAHYFNADGNLSMILPYRMDMLCIVRRGTLTDTQTAYLQPLWRSTFYDVEFSVLDEILFDEGVRYGNR